ncbi:MAG: hypothetical protein JW702_06380 [Clostridiales bacterium]|nr:hypothetical protein [Clostridiales bacterium]
MYIERLKDIKLNEKNIYGSKAANLGFLIREGFKVPCGVVLGIENIEDIDYTQVKSYLSYDKLYSVRSSSTFEDGDQLSYAGQYETILGVHMDNIEEAIVKVHDSQNNIRVSSYSESDMKGHYFGVIVQEMVNADVSGVIFTANPINSDRKQMVIESIYGLGENIVSGLVNTDRYTYDKEKKDLLEVVSNIKDKRLVIKENQLVDEIIMDEEPSLKYEMSLKVFDVAMAIEKSYGSPQDIEYAIFEGEVHILQSRPITTLWPEVEDVEKNHILLSFNAIQVMMDPITPLGMSTLKDVLAIKSKTGKSYLNHINGYIYVDVHALLSNRYLKKTISKFLMFADTDMKAIYDQMKIEKNSRAKDFFVFISMMKFAFPKALSAFRRVRSRNYMKYVDEAEALVMNYDVVFRQEEKKVESIEQRINVIEETLDGILMKLFKDMMPNIAAGIIGRSRITKKYGNDVLDIVEKGVEGNLSTEMGLSLERLSDYLLIHYKGIDNYKVIKEIVNHDSAFASLYNGFIDKFGFRGVGEIDLGKPRYREDTESFDKLIYSQYENGEIGKTIERFQAMKKRALSYQVEDIAKDQMIGSFRALMALREHPKYAISKMLWAVKEVYLSVADDFVHLGKIDDRNDIFYLYKEEIQEDRESYLELIIDRKKQYLKQKKMKFPKIMTADGKCYYNKVIPRKGVIVGTGASSGRIKAQVTIAYTIDDIKNLKGKILVTRFTDPGWTPVFNQISGLITEVGGLMTHGSVVAREYGLPAVVGVKDATALFKEGQWVTIDGNLGTIEINNNLDNPL